MRSPSTFAAAVPTGTAASTGSGGMCGIVAICSPGGGLSETDLTAPVQALRHRGPDGQGAWVSADGRAALGHTRLAVIDLATGDQPIGDGRYHLVASGEFYGYERIRAELAA